LWNEDLEITINTRKEKFRDNIIPIGITSMSAGSKTNQVVVAVDPQSLEQFEISDERSPSEALFRCWRSLEDWDRSFSSNHCLSSSY
jgi:2-iminoacetate synthase